VKALVTGAAGFVGHHLVAHLRAHGDDVTPLDRHGEHAVDVTDADATRRALASVRPDVVYHLAAVSHVGDSWDAPARVFRVNAEGTVNVLHACAAAGVARVVVVGSADVYGAVASRDLPLTEDAPLRPVTPYGASKAAADLAALQAFLGDELETVRVRAFNHTGPGQGSGFLVPALAARIAEAEHAGDTEIAIGSVAPVRDVSDVRDVVRAYRLLADRGEPGEAYNVCSGAGVSVGEIADRLLRLAGGGLHVREDPALVRPVDVPRLIGDPAKLRTATGWEPELTLDRTLADVLDAARARANA
jgi:GDP-4-dehydro-6-deoxy-D-mannose reductase